MSRPKEYWMLEKILATSKCFILTFKGPHHVCTEISELLRK